MWALSKHSRRMAVEHSELQSVIVQRTAELQNLSLRLLKVQDEERRKLSRDLHDSTGQTLAALKISASFLQESCMQDPSKMVLVSELVELVDHAIEEIRTMSYLLHPPLLDEVGFACAAEWYIEGFAKRSGINVSMQIASAHERLPMNIEIALFRVLQESLTNVHRHSGASQVSVCLRHQLEDIILEIRDDGHGIPPERLRRLRETSAETGVGFSGMRERMQELKGKLEIKSDKHGTSVQAFVPRSAVPGSRPGVCRQLTEDSIPWSTQRLPNCCICNNPVSLESSKTDEDGQAVHEDCYVLKFCSTLELVPDVASTEAPANTYVICPPREAALPERCHSPRPRKLSRRFRLKKSWSMEMAVVFAVFIFICLISYSDRHAAASSGSLPSGSIAKSAAVDKELLLSPAKLVSNQDRPRFQTASIRSGQARPATLRPPVGIAEIRVVHIGDDVTVRYFMPKPVPRGTSVSQLHVVHIGGDVTVRHFTPVSANTTN